MAGLTRKKLQLLAKVRVMEARALLDAGLYDGSFYLCGYVLEMSLKACICRTLNLNEYPEERLKTIFKRHSPAELLLLAGLESEWQAEVLRNPAFARNWKTVESSTPDDRYEVARPENDAALILSAVLDPQNGVLQWLTARW